MSARVVVRVPATVANLGPGFDALGMAIAWYNELSVEVHDALEITATGLGADGISRSGDNLVARAIASLVGEDPPRARINQMIGIAFGRGFGSSAAAIVGGLVAARAVWQTPHTDDELLAAAIAIEGHADNVAPCLLGGITVSAGDRTIRLDAPGALRPVLFVAPHRLSTKTARGVLPESVSHRDAALNGARAAALTAALATGRTDVLLDATEDLLHQPYRFGLMPDTADLVARLRARGIAAFLSGAGPSVAALVDAADADAAADAGRRIVPDGWEVRAESFDATGATVVQRR